MADPASDRSLLFASVELLIRRLSGSAPVVLLLEDLQWAAVPTLLLIRHVVRSTASVPLVALLTYRDDEAAANPQLRDTLAALRRESGVALVELGGLTRDVVRKMVEARGVSDDDLAHAVFSRTDGNALFVTELLDDLESAAFSVPNSVRDLVERRVRQLSTSTAKLVRLAAVAGLETEAALLERTTSLKDDELLDALDEACRCRLLTESDIGSFRFRHAVVRDAVYEGLGATRRARLHLQLGETLERLTIRDPGPALSMLAHHFAAAGVQGSLGKAVRYAAAAGDRAAGMTAYEEAVNHYSSARELLHAGDATEECELLIRLGDAQRRAGDPAHRGTLLDAGALARRLDDTGRYIRAVLANHRGFWTAEGQPDQAKIDALECALDFTTPGTADHARVMSVLSMELTFSRADQSRRFALSDAAVAAARASGDVPALADVLAQRVMTLRTPANVNERLRLCAELRELAGLLGDPERESTAASWYCIAAIEAGDVSAAKSALSDAMRAASSAPGRQMEWLLKSLECNLAGIVGDLDRAEELSRAALRSAKRVGEPDADVLHVGRMSAVRLQQGRMGELADDLAECAAKDAATVYGAALAVASLDLGAVADAGALVATCVSDGHVRLTTTVQWTLTTALLSLAVARLRKPDLAAVIYRELEPYSGLLAASSQGTYGCVEHYLGLLATCFSDHERARRHYANAQSVHRRIGARGWLGWSLVHGATAALQTGAPMADARQALNEAVAIARLLHIETLERRAVCVMAGSGLGA